MRKRSFLPLTLALGLPCFASASNLAFQVAVPLEYNPAVESINWISLPYRYYPDGTLRSPQTVADLCVAFNGGPGIDSDVRMIVRQNTEYDTTTTRFCILPPTLGSPFPLVPGHAYMVVPARSGVVLHLGGSEDLRYARNKGGNTMTLPIRWVGPLSSNHNLISLPYHVRAQDVNDICVMLNGAQGLSGPISALYRWNALTSTITSKFCVGSPGGPAIVPGKGFMLEPARDSAVSQVPVSFDLH